MAPFTVAARSNGISITSTSVKKGHPTVVKYTWKYHDNSPETFAVGVIEVSSHQFTLLEEEVETGIHGNSGFTGKYTVSIEVLKRYPGKYVLVLVDVDDYENVYATSKAFQVKKSDF